MAGKITGFFREFVLAFSLLLFFVGLVLMKMGIIWYWFGYLKLGFFTDAINQLADWNAYILVLGFIAFIFGAWYLYSYFKKRKFVLDELKTNKRSELLKKRAELEDSVKHLPSKYKNMLGKKKEELRIE